MLKTQKYRGIKQTKVQKYRGINDKFGRCHRTPAKPLTYILRGNHRTGTGDIGVRPEREKTYIRKASHGNQTVSPLEPKDGLTTVGRRSDYRPDSLEAYIFSPYIL